MRAWLFLFGVSIFAQMVDYNTYVKNTPESSVVKYQFSLTSGDITSGSLSSAGAKTLTLSRCPLGVSGSDTNHSIYISGGVGTAETVAITGGTCAGNGAAGTLSFTTSNTHTGSYTIASATGGLREAILNLGNGAAIFVPSNTTVLVTSNIVVDKTNVRVRGSGWSSVVKARDAANLNSMFYVPSSIGAGMILSEFTIDGNRANTGTSLLFGCLVCLGLNGTGGANDIQLRRMQIMQSSLFGVSISDMNQNISISGSYIHSNGGGAGSSDGGIGVIVSGAAPNAGTIGITLQDNFISNNYPTLTSATFGGGVFFAYTAYFTVVGNQFLNNYNNGGQLAGSGFGLMTGNIINRTGSKSGTDFTSGIETAAAGAVIADNIILGHSTSAGIVLQGNPAGPGGLGSADTTISGNYILTASDCISLINAGGYVRGVTITGNRVAGCTRGLFVDTGAVSISVAGNNFVDSTTAIVDNSSYGISRQGNLPYSSNYLYRGTVASASSITMDCGQVATVSGTTTIQTIVLKDYASATEGAGCTVTLIPSGLWATNASGNIANAVSAVVGEPLTFVYNGSTFYVQNAAINGATTTLACGAGQAVKNLTVVGGRVTAASCGAP